METLIKRISGRNGELYGTIFEELKNTFKISSYYRWVAYKCIRFEDVPLRPGQKENDYCRNKPPTVTGGDLDPCEGYKKAV